MERKIKFRGRRVDNNEWVFGQLVFKKCLRDNGGVEHMLREWEEEFAFIYEDNIENNCEEYPTKFIEVDIKTIGQYTNLKDKNGVDIYEGDKVMFDNEWTEPDEIGIITWNKDTASFQIKGHIPSSSMKHLDRMKVIGNVYENEVD